MRLFTTILLFLYLSNGLFSQPYWVKKPPVKDHQSAFRYQIGKGGTYKDAIVEALTTIASDGGVTVSVAREKLLETGDDLKRRSESKEFIRLDFGEKSFEVQLVEAVEHQNTYYVLYAQKTANARLGDIPGRMKANVFVRRSLAIPSWGQYYNREPVKGSAVVILLLVPTGLAVYNFSQAGNNQNTAKLALATGNLLAYNNFLNSRNQKRSIGHISLLAALTVWIVNVLDAAASEKRRFVFKDNFSRFSLYAANYQVGLKFRL